MNHFDPTNIPQDVWPTCSAAYAHTDQQDDWVAAAIESAEPAQDEANDE